MRTSLLTWRAAQLDKAVLLALGGLFAFTIIKASSTDITYDEGWTFLFYSRSVAGFTTLDIANNHPLNSLLVFFATRAFGGSDFVVRLPNVLAGGLYYAVCASLIKQTKLKILSFSVCALQVYFLDYFSLARGYGIAVALMQYGLVQHFWVGDGTRKYYQILALFLVASLSVFSTAVLIYALAIAHALVTLQTARRHGEPILAALKQDRVALPFVIMGLAPISGLLWVSRKGLPLYGANTSFFDAVFVSVARLYVAPDVAFSCAVTTCIVIGIALIAYRQTIGQRTVTLLLTGTIALASVYLVASISGRPFPTGRVLLSWLPLANLALISFGEDVLRATPIGRRRWLELSSGVLGVALAWSFFARLHFTSANDWRMFADLQPRLVQALVERKCLPPDVAADYGAWRFYVERWLPNAGITILPTCSGP